MSLFDDYNEFADVDHNKWEQYWLNRENEDDNQDADKESLRRDECEPCIPDNTGAASTWPAV